MRYITPIAKENLSIMLNSIMIVICCTGYVKWHDAVELVQS